MKPLRFYLAIGNVGALSMVTWPLGFIHHSNLQQRPSDSILTVFSCYVIIHFSPAHGLASFSQMGMRSEGMLKTKKQRKMNMMHGTWMNEKTDENCHPYYSDPIMDGLPMFGSLWYMVGIIGAIVLVMS